MVSLSISKLLIPKEDYKDWKNRSQKRPKTDDKKIEEIDTEMF
jgi:hypothetical protein